VSQCYNLRSSIYWICTPYILRLDLLNLLYKTFRSSSLTHLTIHKFLVFLSLIRAILYVSFSTSLVSNFSYTSLYTLVLAFWTTLLAFFLVSLYLLKLTLNVSLQISVRVPFDLSGNFYPFISSWCILTWWSTTPSLTKYIFRYPLNAASHFVLCCIGIILGLPFCFLYHSIYEDSLVTFF